MFLPALIVILVFSAVCRLCIILLCLYELVVEINIIHLTFFQLARCKYTIEQ